MAPYSPSPSSLSAWPPALPVPGWRERAAQRLAHMRATAPSMPTYAGNPINIQRHTFGEQAAMLESNRIQQVVDNPPQTAESPQMIWPRGLAILGR